MATIRGTDYDDDIDGTSGNDTIYGYGGDDILYGLGGNDYLYGGSGNDDLWGGTGINTLYGGSGNDYFVMSARTGSALSDNYVGDFEFDIDRLDVRAWGVSDFDQIRFLLRTNSDGNATINAFYGGKNNVLEVGEVSASELESSDFVFTTAQGREIDGTSKNDVLFGTRYADEIYAGVGNDTVLGGQGNDRLYGNDGNDRIVGGRGADVLFGNSGADSFVFQSVADSTASSSARDTIRDFELDRDVIDLSLIDADTTVKGSQAWEWIGRDSFDDSGQLRYSFSGSNTIVSGNTDNDSSVEFQIVLSGNKNLIADDFYL